MTRPRTAIIRMTLGENDQCAAGALRLTHVRSAQGPTLILAEPELGMIIRPTDDGRFSIECYAFTDRVLPEKLSLPDGDNDATLVKLGPGGDFSQNYTPQVHDVPIRS